MLRPEVFGLLKVEECVFRALAGKAMHQVEIDIIKACLSCSGDRRFCVPAVVDSPELQQRVIREALNTQAQTVNARLAIAGKLVPIARAWIGL